MREGLRPRAQEEGPAKDLGRHSQREAGGDREGGVKKGDTPNSLQG